MIPFRRDPFANVEPLIARVYAYVAYRVGDGADAEDITSETFERALRYRSSYDASKGGPAAWLIGIARRCISEAAGQRLPVRDHVPDVASGVDIEEETLRRLEVRAAVAELEDRDRELIALRYGADLSARQIGEVLGMRTNAVEVALTRARTRLAGALGPDSEEDPRVAPTSSP